MNKLQQQSLLSLLVLLLSGPHSIAYALDSGVQALGDTLGAVDYYKLTCAANDTDHLGLKIKDNSPAVLPDPQLLNAHITKDALTQNVTGMKSGDAPKELDMQGGNGKYTIAMDTVGTNLSLTGAQTYLIEYQCLSVDNQVLKTYKSPVKKLKNAKIAKTVANCTAKKKTKTTPAINTDHLHVKISDTTPPAMALSNQVLNAEAFKNNAVFTISDSAGDDLYSNEITIKTPGAAGSGDYFIMINHTGSDDNQNNAKLYEFQARCLNAGNTETGEASSLLLQDQ